MTGIDAEINASKDAEKLVSEMLDLPDKLSKRRGSSCSRRKSIINIDVEKVDINDSKDAEKIASDMLDLPDKLSKRRGSSYSPRFFSLFSVDNILLIG